MIYLAPYLAWRTRYRLSFNLLCIDYYQNMDISAKNLACTFLNGTHMTQEKKASDTFAQGFSCSQAVLSARCERYGLDQKTALTIAAGFGGGMGRTGGTCGAVTAAIAIIGLHTGSTKAKNNAAKENTYKTVREFIAEFNEEFGSVECKELLGCNIETTSGYKQARKQGLFENLCPRLVDGALEVMDRVMDDADHQQNTPNTTKTTNIQ